MFWCSLRNAIARRLPDIDTKINWIVVGFVTYLLAVAFAILTHVVLGYSVLPPFMRVLSSASFIYIIIYPMFVLTWSES